MAMATDLRKTERKPANRSSSPQPAWDIARLFPLQGHWSEEEYLALETNRLVEYADGFIEVLPMPTTRHQRISAAIYDALKAWVVLHHLGEVLYAPLRVRVGQGIFREPDIVFMKADHSPRITNLFWEGADLVIEVISEKNRLHDVETKRAEYARAGIPEYWIVDPKNQTITVLVRKSREKVYSVHGVFPRGTKATSKLLPGFAIDVTDALSL
jgi:Uma2 family endonuclease